jgi:hydroxypyruvate reductase
MSRAEAVARLRADAQAIARAGVAGADPARCLAPALHDFIAGLARGTPVHVIAAGKAARAMMRAALAAGLEVARGLVATIDASGEWPAPVVAIDAGHPVPTAESERAAREGLAIARAATPGDALLVLLSGGASALLAAPGEGLSLADKQATTRLLLAAAASIDEINTVRKHLSAVKGGRLALAAACPVTTFALSDVVGPIADDPSVIGSGPTAPDPTTWADALAVVTRRGVLAALPVPVRARLEAGARRALADTAKPGDPRLARGSYRVIGSRVNAMDAARGAAFDLGYATVTLEAAIVGEARDVGPAFVAQALERARRLPRPVCVIASGETTVHVVGKGRGGRNQELALASAPAIAAIDEPAVLLSQGTDGIDGPTDAAGGVIDGGTAARAAAAGVDLEASLADNDAYTALGAVGDLVRTGPTGTNVGDLQVLLLGAPA